MRNKGRLIINFNLDNTRFSIENDGELFLKVNFKIRPLHLYPLSLGNFVIIYEEYDFDILVDLFVFVFDGSGDWV